VSITVIPTAVSAKTSVNTDGYVAQHVLVAQNVVQIVVGYAGVTHVDQATFQAIIGGANARIDQFVVQTVQTAIARNVRVDQFVIQAIVNPIGRGRITTFVIFPH
jgi:hypothetical protein